MKRHLIALHMLAVALAAPSIAPAAAAGIEAPAAPEVSPPGDISDSQVFIVFKSPAGFSIKVPEGWARKDDGGTTVFNDKYNRIALTAGTSNHPLDLAYAKASLAPEIEKNGRAVKVLRILETKLKAGKAIRIVYDSNSEPNDVTNKQVRQENERFYYAKGGTLVTLDLSAPKGAPPIKLHIDIIQLFSIFVPLSFRLGERGTVSFSICPGRIMCMDASAIFF